MIPFQLESQTELRHFTRVPDETTAPYPVRSCLGAMKYFVPIPDDITSPFPIALSGAVGSGIAMVHYFTVGFKTQGSETSLYRGPEDFVFESSRRTVESAKRHAQREKNSGAVALLKSWLSVNEQDDAEHRETLEYLIKTLDEDRPSTRKLFP